jgi:cytochrome c-type biogenesis protein CcmE
MTVLTLFGLAALSFVLVMYALERRHRLSFSPSQLAARSRALMGSSWVRGQSA